jgi:AraC family transcriptional regulator, regulatory protein of adaptative response / DNA-3-methyladenine glycosylase II
VEPAVLELTYRPPLDVAGALGFLRFRAVPGVEVVDEVSYVRTFRLDDGTCGRLELALTPENGRVTLRTWPSEAAAPLVARCCRLLDLDTDPALVASVLQADPALAPLVAANPGLRLPGAWDGFELAVRAVLGQQVSVAAARTLLGRLVGLAGPALPAPPEAPEPGPLRLFPTAEELLAADLGQLGVPATRRRTLLAVADAVADGRLLLEPGADAVEVRARLLELPGVGPWTAAYVALRALGDGDAFLVGDLALARAAVRAGLPGTWPALIRRAEAWRPWRGYASLLLWSS